MGSITSDATWASDPPTLQLASSMNISALCALGLRHQLYYWVLDHAPTGDLYGVDPTVLDTALGGSGKQPGKVARALVDAGLVTAQGQVVDWPAIGGQAAERLAREQARAERNRTLFNHPDWCQQAVAASAGACHWCGQPTAEHDRRGPLGRTYTPREPGRPLGPDNLVVACRGCAGAHPSSPAPTPLPGRCWLAPEPTADNLPLTADNLPFATEHGRKPAVGGVETAENLPSRAASAATLAQSLAPASSDSAFVRTSDRTAENLPSTASNGRFSAVNGKLSAVNLPSGGENGPAEAPHDPRAPARISNISLLASSSSGTTSAGSSSPLVVETSSTPVGAPGGNRRAAEPEGLTPRVPASAGADLPGWPSALIAAMRSKWAAVFEGSDRTFDQRVRNARNYVPVQCQDYEIWLDDWLSKDAAKLQDRLRRNAPHASAVGRARRDPPDVRQRKKQFDQFVER